MALAKATHKMLFTPPTLGEQQGFRLEDHPLPGDGATAVVPAVLVVTAVLVAAVMRCWG
jgi:hypothetical protein